MNDFNKDWGISWWSLVNVINQLFSLYKLSEADINILAYYILLWLTSTRTETLLKSHGLSLWENYQVSNKSHLPFSEIIDIFLYINSMSRISNNNFNILWKYNIMTVIQTMSRSSTSKTRTEQGGMTAPTPCSPYARSGGIVSVLLSPTHIPPRPASQPAITWTKCSKLVWWNLFVFTLTVPRSAKFGRKNFDWL